MKDWNLAFTQKMYCGKCNVMLKSMKYDVALKYKHVMLVSNEGTIGCFMKYIEMAVRR